MNAKELYRAIGEIDDDLILAAAPSAVKKRRPARRWALVAAACVCLLLAGAYLRFFADSVTWNEAPLSVSAKLPMPADVTVQTLPSSELAAYYGLSLPDALDGGLLRVSADGMLLADAENAVVYDRNLVRYESADGARRILLTLSRVTPAADEPSGTRSRIHGTSVLLTADSSVPDLPLLGAYWEADGTRIALSAEGLERETLLNVIETLLKEAT